MSDEDKPKSFEETLRAIADEVNRGVERLQQGDVEDLARDYGIDTERAKSYVDAAGSWLRAQVEAFNTSSPPARRTPWEDSLRPDPRDTPTEEQGRALAALDSGRWTVEPGTRALTAAGDGPGPSDALGLVRELHVRDWIDDDGELTLTGYAALQRWLDT